MNATTCRGPLAFAIILLSFGAMPDLQAGAWTPEKGASYFKLSWNEFESGARFDPNGDSIDPFENFEDQFSRFIDQNLNFYFEHGLTERLAVFGSLTYKEISQDLKNAFIEVGIENDGLADMDLGLRYQLTDGPNVFAVALLFKLPYFYDEEDDFALGTGEEDIELRALWGRGFGHGVYAGLEVGYRWRLGEPADEYRWLAELGWGGKWIYARAKLDGTRSAKDLESGSSLTNPALNPRYDLDRLELTLGYKLSSRWSVEYTYADHYAGRITADGDNAQLAVVAVF